MDRLVGGRVEHHGAVAAQRHDRLFEAERPHFVEHVTPIETVPIVVLRLVDAQQLRHLMLVDEQDVGGLHEFGRQRRDERGVVQQHLHARFVAHARGCGDGFHRTFQTQAEHGGPHKGVAHGFHVFDGNLRVGAGRVHDGVLAIGVDGDDGGAGWPVRAAHMRGVHAGVGKRAKQEVGVAVGADGAEHPHGGADACGGRRLVAGFAAGQQPQRTAGDGLPRSRQPLCGDGVIHVHGSDHGYGSVDAVQCGEDFGRAHLVPSFVCHTCLMRMRNGAFA